MNQNAMRLPKQWKFQFIDGIGPLLESIDNAEKFIKIVSFQLTSLRVIKALEKASRRGVQVSAITLPPDSYAGERNIVSELFNRLRSAGIDLSLCIWEVGEPRLTTTSLSGATEGGMGQKWYSLHSKFLVSERSALISSSNCTDENRLECYLELRDNSSICEFENKFEYMKEMFITPRKENVPGSLFPMLSASLQSEVQGKLKAERRLLIRDYPSNLCPTGELKPGLVISPFEGKARDILLNMIDMTEEFLFLSSERFFDEELTVHLLARVRQKPITVKLLAGPPQDVRQAPAKARAMVEKILAAGCQYASPRNIHAKLWLNEKWLVIGSPNLTKMNLGFSSQGSQWRADTQVLYTRGDEPLIHEAAAAFNRQFTVSPQGISVLAEISTKIQTARQRFRSVGLKCTTQAAVLVARLESYFAIEALQRAEEISKLAIKLVHREKREKVEDRHVTMAAILLLLTERRHEEKELVTKLSVVLEPTLIVDALKSLDVQRLIKETKDGWVIELDTLVEDEY
jgi:phosphatidylserine/phosphatidylglycerophosphate/cardiolipin synthase-like enzyme